MLSVFLWITLINFLNKSLPSVCMSVCVSLISLLGKGSVNCIPLSLLGNGPVNMFPLHRIQETIEKLFDACVCGCVFVTPYCC
jgi:hypothetical protein